MVGLMRFMGKVNVGLLTVQRAAWKLGPCEVAAKARNIDVPMKCCNVVRSMVRNPTCLCAVALSETARRVGLAPQTELDVVERCGVGSRPVGSKCRAYIWPWGWRCWAKMVVALCLFVAAWGTKVQLWL